MPAVAILLFFALAYVFLALLLRRHVQEAPAAADWEPVVSVIIAARNEENFLPPCLDSLVRLDYPHEKLEIILIDDASTDNSAAIIASYQPQLPNMRCIRLAEGDKEKSGKAGALLAGIEVSCGEIFCITDADCRVPPSWIRALLRGFEDGVGIAGGFTLLCEAKSAIARVQALDWHFLLTIASAAAACDKPVTWVGNNLAVRRVAYDAVGGYRRLGDSFVEDFALINAIARQTNWKCRFYPSQLDIVRTHPVKTWWRLYAQRKRWGLGIHGARPFGWCIMMAGFLAHLAVLIALFIKPIAGLFAFVCIFGVDYLMLKRSGQILREPIKLRDFFLYEIYYVFYSIALPVLLMIDRRITWKGAEMKRR